MDNFSDGRVNIFTMVFSRPTTPAAKCLHLVRLHETTSRSDLVKATGLSQPTVTRAIAALVGAGYVTERNDLTQSKGRGRPTIPLELADMPGVHAGVAVGTESTYVALFDLKGRTLLSRDMDITVSKVSEDDFIQSMMAELNQMTTKVDRPLRTVGVTTSGTVRDGGRVFAPTWAGTAWTSATSCASSSPCRWRCPPSPARSSARKCSPPRRWTSRP